MKRISALLAALVTMVTLAACGKGEPAAVVPETTKVTVFWCDENGGDRSSLRKELKEKLDALESIRYDNQFAAYDQRKQLDQIKISIACGTNLLVVDLASAGDTAAAEAVVEAAGDIPVVFFDQPIGTDGSELALLEGNEQVCCLGDDPGSADWVQGGMIADYLLEHYEDADRDQDGIITYLLLRGSSETAFDSVRLVNEILSAGGMPSLRYFDKTAWMHCQYVREAACPEAGWQIMEENFDRNEIELVICDDNRLAEGVAAFLQEQGCVLPVFGVKADAATAALVQEGYMTGALVQDASAMADAVARVVSGINWGVLPAETIAALDSEYYTPLESGRKLGVAYAPLGQP